MTTTPSSSRCAAVSPAYSQYASSTTSGRAAGQVAQLARRVVWAARERHRRIGVADLRAGEAGCDGVQRVRGRVGDRDRVARPREGPRAEQDQVVRARAEHDLVRLDAGVVADRPQQLGVAAVRVGVDLGEPARDRARPRRRPRPRRNVAVEADDLRRVELRAARELLRGRRPAVGRECLGQRPHRRTAAACAGMPSTPASASTTGRSCASPSAVTRWTVIGRRNVSSPRPPTARAQPPVGRTWLPPVA